MQLRIKKITAWILVIFWMCIIFIMSHQSGNVSSEQSRFVVWVFSLIGLDLNSYFGELATFIVRKGAHFSEYMILYFLVINLIKCYCRNKKVYLYALIIVFLYACTDELHQLFIPGRSGQFKDVMIDTSGGTFGMLLVYLKNINKKCS